MRAVIQRVTRASVTIQNQVKGQIGKSLLVLLAVEEADGPEDIEWLSGKIVRLRIFPDEAGQMNRSVQEVQGDILVISQFTLFASTKKGTRPSFNDAAPPTLAKALYEQFLTQASAALSGRKIECGEFAAMMQVSLCNDGPVTIIIDTKARE